jgi:hypothetical protein
VGPPPETALSVRSNDGSERSLERCSNDQTKSLTSRSGFFAFKRSERAWSVVIVAHRVQRVPPPHRLGLRRLDQLGDGSDLLGSPVGANTSGGHSTNARTSSAQAGSGVNPLAKTVSAAMGHPHTHDHLGQVFVEPRDPTVRSPDLSIPEQIPKQIPPIPDPQPIPSNRSSIVPPPGSAGAREGTSREARRGTPWRWSYPPGRSAARLRGTQRPFNGGSMGVAPSASGTYPSRAGPALPVHSPSGLPSPRRRDPAHGARGARARSISAAAGRSTSRNAAGSTYCASRPSSLPSAVTKITVGVPAR